MGSDCGPRLANSEDDLSDRQHMSRVVQEDHVTIVTLPVLNGSEDAAFHSGNLRGHITDRFLIDRIPTGIAAQQVQSGRGELPHFYQKPPKIRGTLEQEPVLPHGSLLSSEQ